MAEKQNYSLYMLLCDDSILYTGIAIDPESRLIQHQQGHPYGAKFTRRFKRLQIVYQVNVGERGVAQSLEIKLKKLKQSDKLNIIKNQPTLAELQDWLA